MNREEKEKVEDVLVGLFISGTLLIANSGMSEKEKELNTRILCTFLTNMTFAYKVDYLKVQQKALNNHKAIVDEADSRNA